MDFKNLSSGGDSFTALAGDYGLKAIYAIIILIIGFWIVKAITRGLKKVMVKKSVDETLQPFLISIVSITLKVLVIITVMAMIGIQMTSFIAIIGAAGLAVGLALQGTLQNFAGSVMILIFKPFIVGEFIEAMGYKGTVKEIQIFITILLTPDNQTVILPNGPLSNASLINYTRQDKRRVDLVFGISYTDNIDKAREIIMEVVKTCDQVLPDPAPFIAVKELGDSSVNFTTRLWAKTTDYWTVYFYMQEEVKKAFDQNGISIPFPQRDVHLFSEKK